MKNILQINTIVNSGSTGRIAEEIGKLVMKYGWNSYIAYGRGDRPSNSDLIKVGNNLDLYQHVLETRVFDNHGLSSKRATNELIKKIKIINPDIIHLHNIHGYYLNYKLMFDFLKEIDKPVIWTLHDCWSFTGHCAFYDYVNCKKWQTGCDQCPQIHSYPKSLFTDNSKNNYQNKRLIFNSLRRLLLVPVSNWLSNQLKKSFLNGVPSKVIRNGIDLNVFRPTLTDFSFLEKYKIDHSKKIILGVASVWEHRKGFDDFLSLSDFLDDNYLILLIGLDNYQLNKIKSFNNIIGFSRTESTEELVIFYNLATVFFNPSREDNYPTTILESIACGTPVITYDTGGCKEALSDDVGYLVNVSDFEKIVSTINLISLNGISFYNIRCRDHAELNFDREIKFKEYMRIYKDLILNES